jgi:hypothetical protein
VTIGIMIVCTLIQLHRTIFAPWPHDFDAAARAVQDADKALIVSIIGRSGKPAAPIDVESGPFHGSPDDEPSPADMAPFLAPSANAPPSTQLAPLYLDDPVVRAFENGET